MRELSGFMAGHVPDVDSRLVDEIVSAIFEEDPDVDIEGGAPISLTELKGLLHEVGMVVPFADLSTTSQDRALVPVAFGWYHAACRGAHAVELLVEAGIDDMVVPCARSVFEHGVYASMLAQCVDDDCKEEFLAAIEAKLLRSLDLAFSEASAGDDSDLARAVTRLLHAVPASKQAPAGFAWVEKTEQVCRRLKGHDQFLYPTHRNLSSLSHAGLATAVNHLTGMAMTGRPVPFVRLGEMVASVLTSVVWTCQATDHVLGTHTTDAVAHVEARLNVRPLFRAP